MHCSVPPPSAGPFSQAHVWRTDSPLLPFGQPLQSGQQALKKRISAAPTHVLAAPAIPPPRKIYGSPLATKRIAAPVPALVK